MKDGELIGEVSIVNVGFSAPNTPWRRGFGLGFAGKGGRRAAPHSDYPRMDGPKLFFSVEVACTR